MTDSQNIRPDPHGFKIYPRTAISDSPIGVNFTKPGVQDVHVWAAVQHWVIERVRYGDNKFRLTINGYSHTGVDGDNVIASINPKDEEEWEITYRDNHDAYTIALAKDPSLGWTTPTALAMTDKIKIAKLVQTHSEPPQFVPRQLFHLKRDD